MPITGGIIHDKSCVEVSINIAGGKSYKRIYNDVINTAVNKFVLISGALNKIISTKPTANDISFYIEQTKLLLHRAHVELIPGNQQFQNKYNMWLLDGYLRMLLETTDMKLIAQLLDLDSILYSLESVERDEGIHYLIDFDMPHNIKVNPLNDNIAAPIADELSAYLHSFNRNLLLLTTFIANNKDILSTIYKQIIKAASKRLT